MPDTPVWEDVRRDYENLSLTIKDICTRHAITEYQLTKQRLADSWPPRLSATEAATAKYAARLAAEIDAQATRDPERPSAPPAAALPVTTRPLPAASPKRRLTPIAQRRALVQRLYNAIDTKLRLLERRFEREMAALSKSEAKQTSSADNERDIRAIGLLIKNLDHMTEYEHGSQTGKALSGAAAKSAAVAATQLADEADRLRRELGQRLQRLVEAPSPRA